jgi:hypothetical protein
MRCARMSIEWRRAETVREVAWRVRIQRLMNDSTLFMSKAPGSDTHW